MKRYEEFLKFAEKHNYNFTDEEKETFKTIFTKQQISFPVNFGKPFHINLILSYFKEKNIYKNTFNPLNV